MLSRCLQKKILKEKWEEISTELNTEYKDSTRYAKNFERTNQPAYDERKQLLTDAVNMQDELDSAKEENILQLAEKENQHKVFLSNLESS